MKRLIALTLCLCLMAAVFAACGGGASNTSGKPGGERVTIRVLSALSIGEFPAGSDENNNIFVDFLKENTPYDYEFTFVTYDDEGAARSALLAAGNQYDVIKMPSSKDALALYNQGYLAPIDEYLASAPFVMDPNQTPAETWKVAQFDGATYGIPQTWSEAYLGLAMRVDWLNQLGLGVPRTLAEFRSTLEAFKSFNPGGGENVIPFTCSGLGWGGLFEFSRAMWGIHADYAVLNGKVEFTMATQEAKEMMAYLSELYADGLIDMEVATMDDGVIGQRLVTNQVGSAYIPWWSMKWWDMELRELNNTNDPPFWWVPLPNQANGSPSTLKQAGPVEHIMVFPKGGNVKEGVDFINWILNPDLAETLTFGWEGTHWQRDDSGTRFLTEEYDEIIYRWQYGDNLGFRLDMMFESENLEYGDWRIPLEQWAGGLSTAALLIPAAQGVELALENVENHYDTEIAKFLMGERPVSEYDAFISELKALGLDEILAEMQKTYDASK